MFRIPLILVVTFICVYSHAGDLPKPGDDLQVILDRGEDLLLQPKAVYEISSPLVFKHEGQSIRTQGVRKVDDFATLRLVNPEVGQAINGNQISGIEIKNLIIDGNRYYLSALPKKFGSSPLVFLGGSGASNQTLSESVLLNARTWSTIKMHEGATNITVKDNIIFGCGGDARGNGRHTQEVPSSWGDGISCAAKDSLVENNLIIDPTDVGVVVFCAPGTQVRNNVIASISRESLGAINMVDGINYYEIPNKPKHYDYRGVVIRDNFVDARGARIHIAFPMGTMVWTPNGKGKILEGATVTDNQLTGGAAAYGFVADGLVDFTIKGNISTAKYSGIGEGYHHSPPDEPGPYLFNPESVKESNLQGDFRPQERHLVHLLRCNHGKTHSSGYRAYQYGDSEINAVIESAFLEMLGREPTSEEKIEWTDWLQESRGTADQLRSSLMMTREFVDKYGIKNPVDMQLFRTELWMKGFRKVDLTKGWPAALETYQEGISQLSRDN